MNLETKMIVIGEESYTLPIPIESRRELSSDCIHMAARRC